MTTPVFSGLNQLCQHCTGGAVSECELIEETFSPEPLALISAWIREHTKH